MHIRRLNLGCASALHSAGQPNCKHKQQASKHPTPCHPARRREDIKDGFAVGGCSANKCIHVAPAHQPPPSTAAGKISRTGSLWASPTTCHSPRCRRPGLSRTCCHPAPPNACSGELGGIVVSMGLSCRFCSDALPPCFACCAVASDDCLCYDLQNEGQGSGWHSWRQHALF